MNKIKPNKYVLEILETINEFNWIIKRVWVKNNCIYAEVQKVTGVIQTEGLYAGNDDNKEDVYNVMEELKRALIIDKIVKSHCHTKEEGNGITTHRGHMGDRYTMYELIDTIEVSGKKINDDGYNITIYSDKLMAVITYCEGDFIVESCNTKEVYKDRKDYTKKWYKENY